MGPFRSTLLTSLGCALAFALAACGGGDPTPIVAPPSSTASTTPASSAPRTWELPTDQGAVAFVRHWISAFNDTTSGLRLDAVSQISDASCTSCRNIEERARDLYAGGGSAKTRGWILSRTGRVTHDGLPDHWAGLVIQIKQSPLTITTGNGDTQHFRGHVAAYSARLRWTGSAWLMASFDELS